MSVGRAGRSIRPNSGSSKCTPRFAFASKPPPGPVLVTSLRYASWYRWLGLVRLLAGAAFMRDPAVPAYTGDGF